MKVIKTHHGRAFPVFKSYTSLHHLSSRETVYTGGTEAIASVYLSIVFIYSTKQKNRV
jgi:hypothetical protein